MSHDFANWVTRRVEERPGTIGDTCPYADAVDGIQAGESRETGFTTRHGVR